MVSLKHLPFRATVLVVLLVSTSLSGQVSAETLKEALTKAYSTNPQLLAEQAALRATDEEVPQALSGWRPTITVTGEAGKQRIETSTNTETRDPRSVELSVKQPLYRGGRTVNSTKRAEALVGAGRARLHSIEQTVLLATVRAYANVLRDAAVADFTRNNEERLQRQLQASQDRFRVGEITRTDVAQAEARYSQATADRIQAQGAVTNSRAVYRTVVGDMPGTLSAEFETFGLPASEDEAQVMALASNPDVVEARNTYEAALHTVNTVRGELLPEVDLVGSLLSGEDLTARGVQRDVAELTAVLTVPLYQTGDVYSRLRAAKETVSQRREELDDARRAARETATTAWNQLETARAAVRSFHETVRANEIALEGVQRENLVGSRTVLDVLDAEQELLDSQVSLVRAQRDEVVARFELRAAIGNLTARELGLPVKIYDPAVNYDSVRDSWFGTGPEVTVEEKPAASFQQ